MSRRNWLGIVLAGGLAACATSSSPLERGSTPSEAPLPPADARPAPTTVVADAPAPTLEGADDMLRAHVLEAAALIPGDATRDTVATQTVEPPAPRVFDLKLPADFDTLSRAAFVERLETWSRAGDAWRLDDASLTSLSHALASDDERAVRAAVVLGRSGDERAGEVLLARLELRAPEDGRSWAGDVVAADAFRTTAVARDAAARLETLARGPRPHPVLDVRVACAVASVARGRDGAIPFLLAILREGTSRALPRPDWRRLDWTDRRMTALMDSAARALSARAGIANDYRAEGALAAREAEIARLVRLLGAAAGK